MKTMYSSRAEIVTALSVNMDNQFNEFSNPMSYEIFHPLITRVNQIGDGKYLFHERITIFFIPYRFSYAVNVARLTDCKTVMMAEVQKGVKLKLTFEKKQTDLTSNLIEKIEVFGPFLIRRLLLYKVCKAHKEMSRNILNNFVSQNGL